ncbi:hypothetical protein ABAC460_11040 [Asticcacaulis sp. AC460]|nr:hypothetical protein ABAC460_11040 [Asticcacaulis sp. AC460]
MSLVSVTVDETRRLITVRLIGNEPGQVYVDQALANYDRIDQPWRYNRLIDLRQYRGFMALSEIEQVGRYWAKRMVGRIERPRIALLTRDPLAHARIRSVGAMFTDIHFRAFKSRREAMDWLAEMEAAV